MRTAVALVAVALAVASIAVGAAPRAKRASWGALAYNTATGAYGYAVDRTSRRDAEAEAHRQCGGDCDMVKSFRDSCAAIAAAGGKAAWSTGASRAIAEQRALAKCRARTCEVAVWACTATR